MEIWKDIKDFDKYQVSNLGRIRSFKQKKDGKILPLIEQHNYLYVSLSKHCKETRRLVHKLVAETFIDNPYNLPEVNHKDENTTKTLVNLQKIYGKSIKERSEII